MLRTRGISLPCESGITSTPSSTDGIRRLPPRLSMTLSLGYAKGYGENDFEDDEFMISLKIM